MDQPTHPPATPPPRSPTLSLPIDPAYTLLLLLLPTLPSPATPLNSTPSSSSSSSSSSPAGGGQVLLIPAEGKVVLALLYGVVVLLGLGGNLLVCLVVGATRRLRSVTNFLLASQAASDALLSFVCVPWTFVATHLLGRWPFGEVLCKVALYMQASSVYLSAFTMLAISMDRYRAVMDPLKPRVTKTTAGVIIVGTWILALIMSIPVGVYSRLTTGNSTTSCYEVWPSLEFKFAYNYLLVLFQYLIPLVMLTFTYTRIAVAVWVRRTPGEAISDRDRRMESGKKKMIRMMITVVAIYAVCWLPLHAVTVAGDHDPSVWRWRYVAVVWTGCHLLAMSNVCFNPVVYFAMNSKFRDALVVICGRSRCCCCCCYSGCLGSRRRDDCRSRAGAPDGRLIFGDKTAQKSLQPSAVLTTRTLVVDGANRIAARMFGNGTSDGGGVGGGGGKQRGSEAMSWSTVSCSGVKDEIICMTALTSGEQKVNIRDDLAPEMR